MASATNQAIPTRPTVGAAPVTPGLGRSSDDEGHDGTPIASGVPVATTRDLEPLLQQFAEYILKAGIFTDKTAPFAVRWVRTFLSRPATTEPLDLQLRNFCEGLERQGRADWQVRQAEHAVRAYFANFLKLDETEWRARGPSRARVVDTDGATDPLAALDLLRTRIRTRHYSYRTETSYVDWARRFLAYASERDGRPHPKIDASRVRDFLTHLAVNRRVSASTQNQAQSAVLLLCREVLELPVTDLALVPRAKRGAHLPVVLSVPEVAALLDRLRGTPHLMAALIYGGGLRVSECCALRIKDVDFDQGLLTIRDGKGANDRTTLLPASIHDELRAQIQRATAVQRADSQAGLAGVWLPEALERKYPRAGRELGWFWVFPSSTLCTDPRAGVIRRHHIHESVIQKAIKAAAEGAGLHKPASVHTLRHCFATHLLLAGVDIRQIQDYLGHANVETTMVYTHVVRDLRSPARSPFDALKQPRNLGP